MSDDSTFDSSGGAQDLTPAQRLRVLELSGDPDARAIAHEYKDSPVNPTRSTVRNLQRTTKAVGGLFAPTYAYASAEDASEAEARYAEARADREQQARDREQRLFKFAVTANRRERLMVRLTTASVVIAGISLLTSAAAVVVAIVLHD